MPALVSSASSVRSLPYQRSMSMGGQHPRHIPYRNSLLTMVLRDSLGGNCLTAMVATISAEDLNLSESLSTCRFAMRVASIQNRISRNEIIDDKTIIARLRKKITALEGEITHLKRSQGQQEKTSHDTRQSPLPSNEQDHHRHHQSPTNPPHQTDPTLSTSPRMQPQSSLAGSSKPPIAPANGSGLTREGRRQCGRLMQGFVSGRVLDPVAAGISDFSRFRECLRILREMILRSYAYHHKYNPTLTQGKQNAEVKRSIEVPKQQVKRSPETTNSKERPRSSSDKGSVRSYKSPFERKREKSINRLGKSLESQIAEQRQQRSNLIQFKTVLKQQQLENAVKDLGYKVHMTSDHLEKQQELVQNLRQCKASREQITAERVAEKQLAKRLAKYEKRFQLAQEHLQIVRNHIQLQDRVSKSRQSPNSSSEVHDRKEYPIQSEARSMPIDQSGRISMPATREVSPRRDILKLSHGNGKSDQSELFLDARCEEQGLDDQSGGLTERIIERCRHKSGAVDSRRVLDILAREESKQQKVQKEIKKERIKNFTQHFALKEEATLSKLQHFKEQLRKEKEARRTQGEHASSMIQPCEDHVMNAWTADDHVTCQSSTPDQSDIAFFRTRHEVASFSDANGVQESSMSTVDLPSDSLSDNRERKTVVERVVQSDGIMMARRHQISKVDPSNLQRGDSGVPLPLGDETTSSENGNALQRSAISPGLSPTRAHMRVEDVNGCEGDMKDVASHPSSSVTLGSVSSLQSTVSGTSVELSPSSLVDKEITGMSLERELSSSSQHAMSSLGWGSFDPVQFNYSSPRQRAPRTAPSAMSSDHTGSRDGPSSFDAALSAMLHQDRPNDRTSDFMSSQGTSNDQPKDYSTGDVTSTLKSKLLDYLGGKPHAAPRTLSAQSHFSLSSISTLQDKWSIPESTLSIHSAYTDSLPETEDSISEQVGLNTSSYKESPSLSATHVKTPNTPTFQIRASSSTLNNTAEVNSIIQVQGTNNFSACPDDSLTSLEFSSSRRSNVKSMEEREGERSYLSAAKENKVRIQKIRNAVRSADTIQKAWRKYQKRKK